MSEGPVFFEGYEGLPIAADRLGPASAPLVLLAHGGGQTRHSWKDTATRLADNNYQVISMDLRGHGESGWASPDKYTLDHYARDVQAVARAGAGGLPVTFVGASLGGMASTIAAPRMSDVGVSALVLVDVVPRYERGGSSRISNFMHAYRDGFEDIDEVVQAVSEYKRRPARPEDRVGLLKNLRTGDDGRLYWHWDPKRLKPDGRVFTPEDLDLMEASAGALGKPILLVRGVNSDIVSDEGVDALRAVAPQLEVKTVADAEHMVVGDNNAVFGAVLIEFLRRVSPLAGTGTA